MREKRRQFFIQWRNRWSGETGYVGSISVREGHMNSVSTREEARGYANKGLAASAIRTLDRIGESSSNEFTIV